MTMTSSDMAARQPKRPPRRSLSNEKKLAILREYEQAETASERGVVLRRESVYTSQISSWRQARAEGRLEPGGAALSAASAAALQAEVERLRALLERTSRELDSTKAVVEIMGKASALLQAISAGQEQMRGTEPTSSWGRS